MKDLDETMNAKSLFGRRLRVLLAEKNMNQRELAAVFGSDRKHSWKMDARKIYAANNGDYSKHRRLFPCQ